MRTITMEKFVDRETELKRLTEKCKSDSAEMAVIYGRRRTGKTELVQQIMGNREDVVYYGAVELTAQNQLEGFADAATQEFPGIEKDPAETGWEPLLCGLGERDAIVVIDDLPLLFEQNDSFPSRIQKVWDKKLQGTGITLVLVGSSEAVEDNILNDEGPLCGSPTATISLGPLPIDDARAFFPDYEDDDEDNDDDEDDRKDLKTWSVYGGIPFYLQTIDPKEGLKKNINRSILSERGLLHSEPEFLLGTELRQPGKYFSILRALAHGQRTQKEIADMVGLDSSKLSTYLGRLRDMRIVELYTPLNSSPSSRRGRYRISVPLFRFWFRFVYGRQDRLRMLGEDAFEEVVAPKFTDYMSPVLGSLFRRKLPEILDKHPPEFEVDVDSLDVGQWWRKENELDALGLTEEGIVAGECDFTSDPVGREALSDLEDTVGKFRESAESTYTDTQYVVFGWSGHTKELKRLAGSRDDLLLCLPSDLISSRE